MNITNPTLRRGAAALSAASLLLLSLGAMPASAVTSDITMSGAAARVLAANGSSTVLATFSPDLGLNSSLAATLEKSATSTTNAYYGVTVSPATSTPNVHWRITVHHATSSLTTGNVSIEEVGTYKATSGQVRGTPAAYNSAVSSGDLVLTGTITGWSITSGSDFTNVDKISFATGAPTGTYTVTRELINEDTGLVLQSPFAFTVHLTAAATSTSTSTSSSTVPAAPVVLYPTNGTSTTTNPITVFGTAEASSTISITGGATSSSATTTSGGFWTTLVSLSASSTNHLSVTATNATGTSSSTGLTVTLLGSSSTTTSTTTTSTSTTATSSPSIILLGNASTTRQNCGEFQDPGFIAVDSSGATSTVHVTTSGTVSTVPGTYTLTYVATDAQGHTATTTRTVTVTDCTQPSNGGGGGGSSSFTSGGVVINGSNGLVSPGIVTGPIISFVPLTQGQVLGAATFQFTTELKFGSRGQEVVELQLRLRETGLYHAPITGYFGAATRAAVMRLQRNNGLPATGRLDAATRALLNS